MKTLTDGGAVSPAEAKEIVAFYGRASIVFSGQTARVTLGPVPVTCSWSAGDGGEIRLSACLDPRKQPAPAGASRFELAADGSLRLIEDDGSALAFRRAH